MASFFCHTEPLKKDSQLLGSFPFLPATGQLKLHSDS